MVEMIYTPNIAKARGELDQVEAEIRDWGKTQGEVYRIV